ncbi:FKBP-type peptidyl-prolyl cis-trans isomerase [Candidatus Bathyarchaeota archaeon]|nr:FKBP-type peptidyl-prolyl cis-trans isomerase [Candidatus Bathyarchaeota archaeon]
MEITFKVINMFDEEKPEVLVEEDQEEPEEETVEVEAEAPAEEEPVEEEAPEEVPEEEPEEEEVHYENAVNKGDFIMVDMTGSSVETGEVFDTSDEETARTEGQFVEDRTYGSRLVIVGDGYVLRGLDAKLPGLAFDEDVEVEIDPIDAFGARNPDDMETVPYRILRSKGINPYVGAELEIDGRSAIIRSVGAGRVQVDYNHPLAGRKIVYKLKVVEHITDDKDKMRALLGRRFLGIETKEFAIKKTKKKLRIGIPDQIFFGENIQIAKRGVALDILRYFEGIDEIEYYETIKRS